MLLVLELIGKLGGSLGRESRRVFTEAGGTIGRAADCTWALPQAWVSSVHARIEYRAGRFFIIDTSSNGITMPDTGTELLQGEPHAICVGERFEIGEYLLQATLLDDDGLPLQADETLPPDDAGNESQ